MIPVIHEGHRMRIARKEAGLEVRELAARIGISTGTIVNYEKGRTKPKRLALRAWAEVTNVPVYWLETGMAEAPTPPPAATEGEASKKTKRARRDSNPQPSDLSLGTPLGGFASVSSLRRRRDIQSEKVARAHQVQHLTPRTSQPKAA